MKYLIACLFAFGVFTASFAQADAEKKAPCLTCYYIDESTFQCDVVESEGVTKEEWKHEEDMSKKDPSLREDDDLDTEGQGEIETEDDVFSDPSVRDQDLYNEPETESDEGILEDQDAGTGEDDAGVENDPSMNEEHQEEFMY